MGVTIHQDGARRTAGRGPPHVHAPWDRSDIGEKPTRIIWRSATCAEAGYVESDRRSAGRSAALSGARDVAIDAVAVRTGVGDHVRRVAHRVLIPRLRCAVRRAAR